MAAHEAYVLDALREAVLEYRIVPIDEGWQLVVMPDEPGRVAFFGCLQHKTDPACVGLALDAVEASTTTAKPDLPRLSQTDSLRRLKGTGGELLRGITVHVVGDPTGSGQRREGVQAVFREAVRLAQLGEQGRALLLLCSGEATCLSPARIGPHLLEALHRLTQQGVIETASRLEMSAQMLSMLRMHLQWQFHHEARRFLSFTHAALFFPRRAKAEVSPCQARALRETGCIPPPQIRGGLSAPVSVIPCP